MPYFPLGRSFDEWRKSMNATDALISPADVRQIKDDIVTHKWHEAIYEMLQREPELVLVFSDRLEKIYALLEQAIPDAEQRQRLERQIHLLLWVPMVLLNRAHRRLWESFLPDAAGDEKG
jgi:hypothetical protein